MDELLKGHNVLITGAAGRLGRVVSASFEMAGARVVGADADPSSAEVEPCHGTDLTDEQSVQDLFSRFERDGISFQTVVHTVGIWDGRPLIETDLEAWQRLVDVNLTSSFLVLREALRLRYKAKSELPLRLIVFASGQGADRGVAGQAAYSASKAGVIRLVESIADEYADDDVTAHAIAPSMILFDGMEREKGIPVQDLANLCVLLAGPAGSALSGSVVRAYGSLLS